MFSKVSIYLSIIIAVATGCGEAARNSSDGEGGRMYGGVLKISETEHYQTIYPYSVTDAVSALISNQIYEGLVRFDMFDLTIRPNLSMNWEADHSGTVYTFHLKKGVKFQDDPCFPEGKGREVKAKDFKYSFELLCTHKTNNYNFHFTFKNLIKGAAEYYEASANGKPSFDMEGIKVIDDYTLQLTLSKPSASFMYVLASPAAVVVPKEAVEKYGDKLYVGTGPFIFTSSSDSTRVILKKNPNYHRTDSLGNRLPFLDSIVINFMSTKRMELDAIENGEVDVVNGLPSEEVREIVEKQIVELQKPHAKYVLERTPEMASNYYEFNLTKKPFNDIKVRQAFCYAIDKNKIIEQVLKGEAYAPGIYGISPPAFKGYDIYKITGYDYNPNKARKLLAEAGYADGKGFPSITMEVNSGGLKNTNVAVVVQKQLYDGLGIKVDIEVVPLAKKLDDEKYARPELTRAGWLADYPSPESFLWMFYGIPVPKTTADPSYPNTTRYQNPEFDKLFETGRWAPTKEDSYRAFSKAEQLMMNDAPIIVMWYDENYRLIQSKVKNFPANPIRYRNCAEVYLNNTIK